MEKLADVVFSRLLFLMKISVMYMLLVLAGGIVFGLSPASATLLTLYHDKGLQTERYQFKEAFALFRSVFKDANLVFYLFWGVGMLLAYGTYLTVQLPQHIGLIILSIINVFLILYLFCAYMVYLKLQIYYDCRLSQAIKLSAIAVFFHWFSLFKLLLGTFLCFFLIVNLSSTLALFLPSIWLMFTYDVLEPIYQQVEQHHS